MSAPVFRTDQPISDSKNDRLDRSGLVDSIVNTLVRKTTDRDGNTIPSATGLVVGLTGPWGSGKSSLLNLVHERLSTESRTISVRFNPWIFNDRDDLLNRFFDALRSALGSSDFAQMKSLASDVVRYWNTLEPLVTAGAELAGLGTVAKVGKSISQAFQNRQSETANKHIWQPEQAKQHLEDAIHESQCAIVVLIDELDRVEDHEVREVAKLIKAVGDIKGLSYLVAYDLERVAYALGRGDSGRGQAYLEKIIHHAIPLRPLFESDIDLLLNSILKSPQPIAFSEPNERQAKLLKLIKERIKTPRDVVRLEGAFAVLSNAVKDEVCRYDLLAYCLIMTKAPRLQKVISEHNERLVDDPSDAETLRRGLQEVRKQPHDIESEFGITALNDTDLLSELFPRFGRNTKSDDIDHSQICKRRNLRRVLYLGYPPDMIRRETIEHVWRSASFDELTAATKSTLLASLPALFERLDASMSTLDPAFDAAFWVALSHAIARPIAWGSGRERLRYLVEDATAVLGRFANRNSESRDRARNILSALILAGDLAIVPRVVRNHIFRFGKHKEGKPRPDRPQIWGENEFRAIFVSERERYRLYVDSAGFLESALSFETGFALLNTGHYSDTLRSEMSKRLFSVEAISTFAALLVPPGHIIDAMALDEIIDVEAYKLRSAALPPPATWPVGEYRQASAKRLFALAHGHDPMFLDDVDAAATASATST